MATFLLKELGIEISLDTFGEKDHCFDAAMAALAALRGLNGDWSCDLHVMLDDQTADRIQFVGCTHYWWPPTTVLAGRDL